MSEKPGYRKAMERMQGRMIRSGMNSRDAEIKAKEIAIRRHKDADAGRDKPKPYHPPAQAGSDKERVKWQRERST